MIDKNPEKIKKMFDLISSKYDFMNDIISFKMHKLVKYIALKDLELKNYNQVLDLCCGSGDLAILAKKIYPKIEIIGVDFSEKMINIAKKRDKNLSFLVGDAKDLQFKDNQFDCVLMGFGLRNIDDTSKALKEVHRVLKSDGKFLHLDFNSKAFLNKFYDVFIKLILFFLKNKEAYLYLIQSKNEFKLPDDLDGFKLIKKKTIFFDMISYQIFAK